MHLKSIGKSAVAAFVLVSGLALGAAPVVQCEFQQGKWHPDDFLGVKSSRWVFTGHFIQEKDHLRNAAPADAAAEELMKKRAPETYAALLYKKPLTGPHTISAAMSFDHRMAPSIVIAEKPELNGETLHPEFRTHYEIVLFDQGLNIWRHWFVNGKQIWKKVAFLKADFKPNTRYTLTVSLQKTHRGPQMTVSANGHTFGILDADLPETYYAGIIGCEGINRFYDFKIE